MPPSPPPGLPARSSAQVNEEIRALIRRARGRSLGDGEQRAYRKLLKEWAEATQAEAGREGYVRAA